MVSGKDILIAIGVIILLIVFFFYASTVSAYPITKLTPDGSHLGDFRMCDGCQYYNIFAFIFSDNIDNNWVTPNGLIQYLVLPFAAIALVMYGVLSEVPLGGNVPWFNTAMALIIALVVSSSGLTVRAMRGYMTIAGNFAIGFFGFILVVGIALQGFRRMGAMGIPMGALKSVVNEAEIRNYVLKMVDTGEAFVALNPKHKNAVDIQKHAADAALKLSERKLKDAKKEADAIKGLLR